MNIDETPQATAGHSGQPGAVRSTPALAALLVLTQLAAALAYTVPIPILADMAASFPQDSSTAFRVKLVSGILGPSMALGSPFAGWLAGRFDRRGLLLGFGLLVVLAGAAPASLDALNLIIASRFVMGFAAAGLMTLGFTMTGDYLSPEKRIRMFGLLSASSMITSIGALPLAGVLGEKDWHPPFLIYLLPAIVLVLALPQRLPAPRHSRAPAAKAQRRAARLPYGFIVLALAIGLILAIPGVYLSFHLTSLGFAGSATVGLVMMSISIVSAIASVGYGRAVARAGQRMIFLAAFGTMAFGLGLVALTHNLAVAIAGLLVSGIGTGWLVPNFMAALSDRVSDEDRGRAVGLAQSAMAIAPMVGLAMLEPLVARAGTGAALGAVAALAALLFVRFLFNRPTNPPGRPENA